MLTLHSSDGIWHPGTIEDVLVSRFSVKCTVCGNVVEESPESAVAVFAHEADNERIKVSHKPNQVLYLDICLLFYLFRQKYKRFTIEEVIMRLVTDTKGLNMG